MDIMEAIRLMRSIRAYQDRLAEQDKLNRVLEARRLASSARNLLDWRLIVVQEGLEARAISGRQRLGF